MTTKPLKKRNTLLNPKSHRYEFFGPLGTGIITIISPLFLVYQYITCNSEFGCSIFNINSVTFELNNITEFITLRGMKYYLLWLSYHLVCWYILPGKWVNGIQLRTGEYQKYKMNGFLGFIITNLIVLITYKMYGSFPFLFVVDICFELLLSSLIFTFVMSTLLYINSFIGEDNKLLSLSGNTDSLIHDFFMGRELNPSIGNLDLKQFFELRPGLMGWSLLNFCFLLKQIDTNNTYTYSILFVTICQYFYVADSLYNEEAVLTTMDITTDGFGFMLCFGDISWVPFFYSIQTRYLSIHPIEMSYFSVALIAVTSCMGYSIFRLANNEKNIFKKNHKDPKVAHLNYIESDTGRKLLVDGWWGIASHINYLGDWLLSLSQCLATGFGSIIPYFFAGYFAILLIHRDSRDDYECSKKYGKTWLKYRQLVPYRILPGIY
ncbi:delta14-sterol reductase [Neoconidiobolus thromboides FSU 785]|nr:delta14-sterol reductase [Neoconidiobolus thromboides FSU 785]